jgi:hypothetical protein
MINHGLSGVRLAALPGRLVELGFLRFNPMDICRVLIPDAQQLSVLDTAVINSFNLF